MNIFILDVVLLSTYFRDAYDEIYSDITDHYQCPLSADPERFVSTTG